MYCVTGNRDYIFSPSRQNVTFQNGQTSVQVSYRIIDDSIVEDNEKFILSIDPSSLPSSVSLGSPSQATVTIQDDDSKWCCIISQYFINIVNHHVVYLLLINHISKFNMHIW